MKPEDRRDIPTSPPRGIDPEGWPLRLATVALTVAFGLTFLALVGAIG